MMSSHLALPRKGHMEQVMKIFGYLRKYHNAELMFDPSDPTINEQDFERRDWASSEFRYEEGKEDLPPNMPEPRGLGFTIVAKVDADHASDVENLNQVRTDRRTVELRFSWECVLSHTWISPWTQKGILLYGLDPRMRSITYVVMDDETNV